jgi:hypothetical protein
VWLLVIVLGLRAASPSAPGRGDLPMLAVFSTLVLALAGIAAYAR